MKNLEKYRAYENKWFDNEELHRDLKEKSIKGGISTSGSQFIRFGINLVSTFILARILLPSDFGLIGMVTAFTGFAAIIQDMGLSTAVIQKETITHIQVTNLFWINLGICCLIAILFVLLSPLIVSLYHYDHRLYSIILSYAAGIIISGLSIQHTALLNRRMMFLSLAKVDILAAILSVACGVTAAFLGWGYWAIIILNLSQTVFTVCLVWIACEWRPSWPKMSQSVKDFIHFGAGISGFNIINYFSRNSDDILIGNRLGPIAVGFYSKAYQLLMLPINQLRNPLMSVALPAMSKLQNDAGRYISYYKKYTFILAFFSMPLVISLAIFSREIVLIVLGAQWIESGKIFLVLAIAAFVQPVSASSGLIMISSGQTKKYFIIGTINSCTTIAGFIIGIHWGVIGMAVSFVVTVYLELLPTLYFAYKDTPIKMRHFLEEVCLPAIHSLLICGVILTGRQIAIQFISPILAFFILIPIGLVIYYFSWKTYPLGRKKLVNIEDLINVMIQKIRKKDLNAEVEESSAKL